MLAEAGIPREGTFHGAEASGVSHILGGRAMRTTKRRHPVILGLLVLIIGLVLAACGSQTGASAVAEQADGGDRAVGLPAGSAGAGEEDFDDEQTGGGPDGEPPNAVPIEQRIIKTGEVGLLVDNVAATLARVRGMAVEMRGYVGGSQAGTLDESASVTLRIPADRSTSS